MGYTIPAIATLQCLSLGTSLAIAFLVTVPVNRWLIGRGKGHAVIHELHGH